MSCLFIFFYLLKLLLISLTHSLVCFHSFSLSLDVLFVVVHFTDMLLLLLLVILFVVSFNSFLLSYQTHSNFHLLFHSVSFMTCYTHTHIHIQRVLLLICVSIIIYIFIVTLSIIYDQQQKKRVNSFAAFVDVVIVAVD